MCGLLMRTRKGGYHQLCSRDNEKSSNHDTQQNLGFIMAQVKYRLKWISHRLWCIYNKTSKIWFPRVERPLQLKINLYTWQNFSYTKRLLEPLLTVRFHGFKRTKFLWKANKPNQTKKHKTKKKRKQTTIKEAIKIAIRLSQKFLS